MHQKHSCKAQEPASALRRSLAAQQTVPLATGKDTGHSQANLTKKSSLGS